jgi:hypothetical protein
MNTWILISNSSQRRLRVAINENLVTGKFLSIVVIARGAQFEVSRRGSILELISSHVILVGL